MEDIMSRCLEVKIVVACLEMNTMITSNHGVRGLVHVFSVFHVFSTFLLITIDDCRRLQISIEPF
jgi:hypothetical protein